MPPARIVSYSEELSLGGVSRTPSVGFATVVELLASMVSSVGPSVEEAPALAHPRRRRKLRPPAYECQWLRGDTSLPECIRRARGWCCRHWRVVGIVACECKADCEALSALQCPIPSRETPKQLALEFQVLRKAASLPVDFQRA